MIKKIVLVIVAIAIIGLMGTIESTYTRDVVVTKVHCVEVTVEDSQGFVWSFCGEGYQVGQMVTLKMNDNHTDIITDDIIIGVK